MKNKLLFRKAVTQLFLSLCLMLFCTNTSWGQAQTIGSFPYMDGGFEGQSVGTLADFNAAVTSAAWTKSAASGASSIGDTGARTGSRYATGNITSTSLVRVLNSPTVTSGFPTPTSSYVVQYYIKNSDIASIPVGIGSTGSGYVSPTVTTGSTTWTKYTQVVTSNAAAVPATPAYNTYVGIGRLKVTTPITTQSFLVDDVVVYAGTSADVDAPVAASGGAVSGLNVSWTASTDVDGGGYMVVRYATNPNLNNDPNANGIYAKGNIITNGTGSLNGTVVYVGTSISFTDDVAGSSSGTDYYKIYTVDKAFNYATELIATAVVSNDPTITSSSELLTGFNYIGAGPSTSQSFTVSGSNLSANLVVSTASTDFELSTDNFATAGVSTINLSGATVAASTISVRLKSGLVGGPKSGGTVSVTSSGANVLPAIALSGSVQAVYYYNGSGLLSSNTSWGANSNGSGANPTAVTDSYTNFVFANGSATTDAVWILGANSKVIVGNGSEVTLTVDTFPITGTIDVTATGIVVWKSLTASPTFGTLDNASEVHFQPADAATYALGVGTAYGKLFIDGVGIVSVGTTSTPTVKTSFSVPVGSYVSFPTSSAPTVTINAGATATIDGTIKTSKSTGLFASTGSMPLNASATLILGAASTIEFFRANVAQTVNTLPSGVSYANLILSENNSTGLASKSIAGPITVNGTLTVNLPGNTTTTTGANNITLANGATIVMTAGTLNAAPTFAGTVNVIYNGTGLTQIYGTTTTGSSSVTLASSNAAISAGMTVIGNGVPAATTVASISGTALVLSANATATAAAVAFTFGTASAQSTGVELPTADGVLNNLTIDNTVGVTFVNAANGGTVIAQQSSSITLNTAETLKSNVQVNGTSELTLNVNANQANLKQIVFSGATTAKLKLNMNAAVTALAFANSSAQNWDTGTVEITGFQEGKIRVGTTNSALTATQLGLIKDTADLGKTFKLSDQGYLYYSTTIVPGDGFVVTSDNPLYLAVGTASTYVITATNSPTSFVLGATALPAGLTLNTTTGAITGTPTTPVTGLVVPITLSNSVNLEVVNFTFNVKTRTNQAITWSQTFPATNTYGDATIALTATNSSPLSVSYSSSNTFVATISGSTLTIVGPGTTTISASQAGDPDYNPATTLTKELVVNAKALSIADATATDKTYNKTTTATITGTLAGGLVGADVVTLVLSGTFADANVANAIAVTSTSTLAGADAAKYSLTQPSGLTANITKASQLLASLGTSAFHILGDPDYDPMPLVTDPNITGLPSVAIENPSFDYTSSDTNVATIVGGKVHIVGLGSTTLTAVQSESANYTVSLPVSQTLTVLSAPLAAWDFYNFSTTSSGGTPAQATSIVATEVATGITSPSLSMGNMTTTLFSNKYRFQSSEWPCVKSDATVAPIDITNGKYMSVTIAADNGKSMSLSSINAAFRGALISNDLLSQFAYSTDGTNFTAIGTPTNFQVASSRFYSTIDLSGIAALQNLPSGTTVTLRYYASGRTNSTGNITNNQRQWGFFSDFVPTNTRGLIIGGSVATVAPVASAQSLPKQTSTVANLIATGTAGATLKWYDADTGGTALLSSAALTTNTYYVSQTLDGQESSRTAVAVTIYSQIPANGSSALTFCKGATIASAIGSTSLKFYTALTGGTPLVSTTALTSKALFVTEMTNGQESTTRVSRTIVVNNLPATPSALTSTESALICKYIGSPTPVTFNATAASAVSYIWTVPAGAVIDSGANSTTGAGTSSSIGVNFAGASTTAGAIGAVTVKSVDANGCVSLVKSLTLTTKAPTAPTSLVMTSTDSTPSFKGIITPADPLAVPPTAAVYGLVGLNTLTTGIKKVGPYTGTSTVFTLTAPAAVTAASYLWTLPTGVNAIASETVAISSSGVVTSTTPVITANFAGVTSGTSALPIVVQSVGGCGNSTNRTLTLARAIPSAPTALALTNTSQANLSSLAKITKVGPYTGTEIPFTLTATPFTTQGAEATSYAWVLPAGVVCTTCSLTTDTSVSVSTTATDPITLLPVTTTTTLAAFSSPTNTITVNFSGATGTGNLDLKVFGVNGAGNSIARTLVLARALPSTPTKLVLTDNAISATVAVTKVGPYTAKETPLTLTATPFTTQGAEATSFSWVLPAGVNVTAGVDEALLTTPPATVGTTKTWTGTSSVLTINLNGIGTGITSIPLSVYAVNGAGTSAAARTLTVTSAAPATPTIVGSVGTTTLTTFSSCETAKTYTATAILGATYTWVVPTGASIVGASNGNVIMVDYSAVTAAIGASAAVTCSATNGTGTSGIKSLTVKRVGAICSRLAPEAASATEAFSVVAYPNPSTEGFKVTSSNKKSFGVQVYDMLGRSIEKRQMTSDSQIGSNYAKGIYNVIVTQDANVKTLRVIKQ